MVLLVFETKGSALQENFVSQRLYKHCPIASFNITMELLD